jgi:hypothetical protein
MQRPNLKFGDFCTGINVPINFISLKFTVFFFYLFKARYGIVYSTGTINVKNLLFIGFIGGSIFYLVLSSPSNNLQKNMGRTRYLIRDLPLTLSKTIVIQTGIRIYPSTVSVP